MAAGKSSERNAPCQQRGQAAYADYRKARDDMKELLTIKANVDRLMGYDDQEKQKEADRQEEQR